MRYHVTLRSRTYVIDVDGGSVTVDGEKFEAHAAAIPGTPLLHLLLGPLQGIRGRALEFLLLLWRKSLEQLGITW